MISPGKIKEEFEFFYPRPLLIGVPRRALPDLNLRPIFVYSVGDVLHKELETIQIVRRSNNQAHRSAIHRYIPI
jgi:hypothetical protein